MALRAGIVGDSVSIRYSELKTALVGHGISAAYPPRAGVAEFNVEPIVSFIDDHKLRSFSQRMIEGRFVRFGIPLARNDFVRGDNTVSRVAEPVPVPAS